MRLRPGCGCLLLVLAAFNAVLFISAIVGLVIGEMSIQLAVLAMAVFGANAVASAMLGMAGLRGQRLGARREAEEADTGTFEEAEGPDADHSGDEGSE